MSSDDLLFLILISVEMVFDALVVSWMSGRAAKRALIRVFAKPDEEAQAAFAALFMSLWGAFGTKSIEIKAADGTLVKVSAYDLISRAVGESVVNRIRGLEGSIVKEAQESGLLQRKGEDTGQYLARVMGQRLMPKIQQAAESYIDKVLKEKMP